MSDNDKEIRILFKAEGADGAVNEIKKVEKAQDDLQGGDGVVGFGDNGRAASMKRAARLDEEEAAQRAIRNKGEETAQTRALVVAEKDLSDVQQERAAQGAGAAEAGGLAGAASFIKNNKDLIAGAAKGAAALAAIQLSAQIASATIEDALGKLQETGTDIDKLKDDNPGSFAFFEAVKAVANPLDTVKKLIGDIYVASIGGLLDLDGIRLSALQASNMAHQLERGKSAMEALNEADKALRLDNLRQSGILLKAENDELERRQRLLNAERSLASTEGRINDQARIAGGEDPGIVGAQRAVLDAAAEAEKLKDGLAKLDLAVRQTALGVENTRAAENEARGDVRRLALEYQEAMKVLREARGALIIEQAKGGTGEKQNAGVQAAELAFDEAKRAYEAGKQAVDKAATDSLAADQTFESAKKDFEAKQQTNAIELREIGIKAGAEIKQLANDASTEVTAQVQAAMDLISAAAAEQGGRLSSGAKQSLDNLGKIIADNVPDSEQVEAIRSNFMVLQSTTEGRNATFAAALDGMMQTVRQSADDARRILSEISAVQANQASLTGALSNVSQQNERLREQIIHIRK